MNKGFGMMMALLAASAHDYHKCFDVDLHMRPTGKRYYGEDPERTGEYYRDAHGCLRKK